MTWVDECLLLLAAEFNNPGALVAAIHAGSSSTAPLEQALDVDIILFVNSPQDGSIYIEYQGMRVEGVLFSLELADTYFAKAIHSQKVSLIRMIVQGRQIYGEESTIAQIREKARRFLETVRPIFISPIAAFSGHTFLRLLKRATRAEDIASTAISIIDFMAKIDGPERGEWPSSTKRMFRPESSSVDNATELFGAFQKAVAGDKRDLLALFEDWLSRRRMHDETSFKMITTHKRREVA